MRHSLLVYLGVALLAVLLTACGRTQSSASLTAAAPIASATQDACAPQNIKSSVAAVNQYMRKFDDESALASSVPRSQLALHIAALQSIRRGAQDQAVPTCLARLKQLQITAMNSVIDTLMSFLGRGDQQAVTSGIAIARQEHDQYLLEMARVMGLTAVVVTRAPVGSATAGAGGTPAATPSAVSAESQATASSGSGFIALNPGPASVNLRATADNAAQAVGTLEPGKSAAALGITSDGAWIQVVVPGRPDLTAWVLATDVQVTYPNP
jgi:hypothetical protein